MADASVEVFGAVMGAMRADSYITGIVATRIYSKAPDGATLPYIAFGQTDARRDDVSCISGKEIFLQVDVYSSGSSQAFSSTEARNLADAIERAVHQKNFTLATNRLVSIEHRNTLVFLDADEAAHHAVVNFVAYTESI